MDEEDGERGRDRGLTAKLTVGGGSHEKCLYTERRIQICHETESKSQMVHRMVWEGEGIISTFTANNSSEGAIRRNGCSVVVERSCDDPWYLPSSLRKSHPLAG